jgi:hypothetical protein
MQLLRSCGSCVVETSDLPAFIDPQFIFTKEAFMTEDKILFQVSDIVSAAKNFSGAVEKIRALLERALGGGAFAIELPEQFFETPDLPHPSVYLVPLRSSGREVGKLIAYFASSDFHGAAPRRISNYVGQQLGMLLERTRLGKDRARLEGELSTLREELATRKAVQRAQGILMTRHGMPPASAKLWISQQSRQSRLSMLQVAEQVVARETAERLVGTSRRIA